MQDIRFVARAALSVNKEILPSDFKYRNRKQETITPLEFQDAN